MAVMIGELYDALRAAGCDHDVARVAAEAVYREQRAAAAARHFPTVARAVRPSWLIILQAVLALLLLINAVIFWIR